MPARALGLTSDHSQIDVSCPKLLNKIHRELTAHIQGDPEIQLRKPGQDLGQIIGIIILNNN